MKDDKKSTYMRSSRHKKFALKIYGTEICQENAANQEVFFRRSKLEIYEAKKANIANI